MVVLLFIDFLEERECVETLGRLRTDISPLFPFSMQAIQRNPSYYSHHNKGFINYVFCRNWAVRNLAGIRLDTLAW